MSVASALVVFAACLLPCIHGSAIPMWEYLSRGEKMSHLFNLFVRQVERHCSSRPEPDCGKLLLVYGLTNLAKMEDESLDDMDPYQRGANEIVWDSMMKGSSEHERATTPSSVAASSTSNSIDSSKASEDLDISDPGSLEAASNVDVEEAEPQSFLLGPMVVRVLPNGMPVPGEKNQLPKDEDIEELAPARFRPFPNARQKPADGLGFRDHAPPPPPPPRPSPCPCLLLPNRPTPPAERRLQVGTPRFSLPPLNPPLAPRPWSFAFAFSFVYLFFPPPDGITFPPPFPSPSSRRRRHRHRHGPLASTDVVLSFRGHHAKLLFASCDYVYKRFFFFF